MNYIKFSFSYMFTWITRYHLVHLPIMSTFALDTLIKSYRKSYDYLPLTYPRALRMDFPLIAGSHICWLIDPMKTQFALCYVIQIFHNFNAKIDKNKTNLYWCIQFHFKDSRKEQQIFCTIEKRSSLGWSICNLLTFAYQQASVIKTNNNQIRESSNKKYNTRVVW